MTKKVLILQAKVDAIEETVDAWKQKLDTVVETKIKPVKDLWDEQATKLAAWRQADKDRLVKVESQQYKYEELVSKAEQNLEDLSKWSVLEPALVTQLVWGGRVTVLLDFVRLGDCLAVGRSFTEIDIWRAAKKKLHDWSLTTKPVSRKELEETIVPLLSTKGKSLFSNMKKEFIDDFSQHHWDDFDMVTSQSGCYVHTSEL